MFDEFLLFVLAVQMLKEKAEEAPNAFPMHPVWTTEQIIENLPYDLTKAHPFLTVERKYGALNQVTESLPVRSATVVVIT